MFYRTAGEKLAPLRKHLLKINKKNSTIPERYSSVFFVDFEQVLACLVVNYFRKMFHLKCLTGSEYVLHIFYFTIVFKLEGIKIGLLISPVSEWIISLKEIILEVICLTCSCYLFLFRVDCRHFRLSQEQLLNNHSQVW